MNLFQIYSLNGIIPSFRNRIYSGDKVIPEIRHINFIPGIELFLISRTGPKHFGDIKTLNFFILYSGWGNCQITVGNKTCDVTVGEFKKCGKI